MMFESAPVSEVEGRIVDILEWSAYVINYYENHEVTWMEPYVSRIQNLLMSRSGILRTASVDSQKVSKIVTGASRFAGIHLPDDEGDKPWTCSEGSYLYQSGSVTFNILSARVKLTALTAATELPKHMKEHLENIQKTLFSEKNLIFSIISPSIFKNQLGVAGAIECHGVPGEKTIVCVHREPNFQFANVDSDGLCKLYSPIGLAVETTQQLASLAKSSKVTAVKTKMDHKWLYIPGWALAPSIQDGLLMEYTFWLKINGSLVLEGVSESKKRSQGSRIYPLWFSSYTREFGTKFESSKRVA